MFLLYQITPVCGSWYQAIMIHVSRLTFIRTINSAITMTSSWARWRLESPAPRLFTQAFIQAQIKEKIKAPRKISLKFVPKGPFDHNPALVQIMPWRRVGKKANIWTNADLTHWRIHAALWGDELMFLFYQITPVCGSWYQAIMIHVSRLAFIRTINSAITMTSSWARWRLESPASRLFTQAFIQAQIKENIKALRHWPLCEEFTGDRWIPRTKGQ